jgi:hypothetical protein
MNTKTVYIILTYRAEVPEDMDINKIHSIIEDEKYDDCFRINVRDYPDEDLSEPLFGFENVEVGTGFSLAVSID